ncbi:PP2C family protein-serine/threonine phosphatase [Psychrobacter sp. FDAARGOS_221]|uniref:PP2C family protein-serine/threonine phosphatase n=1 Tax=Psychrobacter sp. FDAARGOS_221 TaxID=1975705 RepID=UPI000BB56C3F|nr:protein phosphatase 2C domain-containing protein [Psychrobacter sp. FDAARGOS_221]PNK59678.1 protein phosphatase [Psychrobacter sp. FDAARGOS_221]
MIDQTMTAKPASVISATACAITFQGNASNQRQQDAFFFIDDYFQETLGITEVTSVRYPFCLAVSDGVSSSNYSQHCSKAVVKAVKTLMDNRQPPNAINIHKAISETKHITKRYGASATLAMFEVQDKEGKAEAKLTHVGDSRVYRLASGASQWQCLTRDHNLLNELIDEQLQAEGTQAKMSDYNKTGMAGMLYSITECYSLSTEDEFNAGAPQSEVNTIDIQSGDCFVVCTDGIHDLVPNDEWELIDEQTDIQQWLLTLKTQVYQSEGNAYDNGTAIVVRFD